VGKLIVISAPSGAGKTSIVHFLLNKIAGLSFSVSACSRTKRENETDGIDYHFLAVEEFQKKIKKGDFLEWEEVYKNQYYGTLKSETERIWEKGETVIFDVDVLGGLNIKKQYTSECLAIFIMPPSLETLEERLQSRGSESADSLHKRISKAKGEIARSGEFDKVILNDNFDIACEKTMQVIRNFIKS
jgi:guanylate kinase